MHLQGAITATNVTAMTCSHCKQRNARAPSAMNERTATTAIETKYERECVTQTRCQHRHRGHDNSMFTPTRRRKHSTQQTRAHAQRRTRNTSHQHGDRRINMPASHAITTHARTRQPRPERAHPLREAPRDVVLLQLLEAGQHTSARNAAQHVRARTLEQRLHALVLDDLRTAVHGALVLHSLA